MLSLSAVPGKAAGCCPNRLLELIVGHVAGSTDFAARPLAEALCRS
jgi:hypothetical protein